MFDVNKLEISQKNGAPGTRCIRNPFVFFGTLKDLFFYFVSRPFFWGVERPFLSGKKRDFIELALRVSGTRLLA